MKKSLLILSIFAFQFCFSQINFSVKAHLLVPTSTGNWSGINQALHNTYNENGKNNVGYNLGLSCKIPLVGTGFFVMPEVYYTSLKNEFNDPNYNTTIAANTNRIDVPLLVGANVIGQYFGVYAGPVLEFNLKDNASYNDFISLKNSKEMNVGYQIGAQITLDKIIISGRFEGSFSNDERAFINSRTNNEIEYTQSQKILYIGLGYKF